VGTRWWISAAKFVRMGVDGYWDARLGSFEETRKIKKNRPGTKVLFLTSMTTTR